MVCATALAAKTPSRPLRPTRSCLRFMLAPRLMMVMRHSVRASSGSVSVAECSSDALSQIPRRRRRTTGGAVLLERGVALELVEQRARSRSACLDAERAAGDA